ncbi:MAG: glycerophosphodiester phosphodiesterase family protein, partial [Verrucomicrobiota bacterium]
MTRAFCLFIFRSLTALLSITSFGQIEHYQTFESSDALSLQLRWTENRSATISAHRGGPEPGFPENAIETFENALKYGRYYLECDLRKTSDSVLILMHDETLDRTTNGEGAVEEFDYKSLRKLRLVDNDGALTEYKIPTLTDALVWARGKSVLMLDIKQQSDFKEVIKEIRRTESEGHVVLIVYTIETLKQVHAWSPDLNICVGILNMEDFVSLKSSDISLNKIVAYVGVQKASTELIKSLHGVGVKVIQGTMGEIDDNAAIQG